LELREVIFAFGHENVLATHRTTFEITKKVELSKRGDCIIAVSADKSLTDLGFKFREGLKRENAKISIFIEAGDVGDAVNALGSSKLILSHPTDMVIRKSSYICGRTLAIKADKAACDLSRSLVEKLRNPKQKVKITLTVKV
jgi:hypothetical protein